MTHCRFFVFRLSVLLSAVVMAAGLLWGSSLWAMPLHPQQIEKMRDHPELLEQEQRFEEELRARGVNNPTIVPRMRDLLRSHLDENFNILAILVDFSDHTATTAASFFDSLLYGSSTGKLNHYIGQVTYGNLTLVTLNMPSAQGWRRAPQTYAYYVDGQRGFGTYPRNAQRMTEDAITLANPTVNFSNYDNDSDGWVDALFIIHSGSGYEKSGNVNDIHSHAWATSYPMLVDGVYCYTYSTEPEYWSTAGDMTCGVYAHEMGHSVFGLPDLYDYGYDSRGLGSWSLMAGGSWNGTNGASPAHPDAYSRVRMGAATATVIASNQTGVSIPAIETTPTIYRLWTNGTTGSQYFLVENRRLTGYDAALPSQGLMIYHVDQTQTGNNNQWYPGRTDSGNYLVALEQSDGLFQLEQDLNSGNAGDPYPGSGVRRTFDTTTTPDSRSYSGTNVQVAVRNISNSAATMTADLYVTNASLTLTAPNGGEQWFTGQSQTLTWSGTGFSGNVRLLLNRSHPSGAWDTLYANTANDGNQAWTVTGPVTSLARVKVVSVSMPAVSDTSNANFTIAQRSITLTFPNGGDTLTIGTTRPVTWTSQWLSGDVCVELKRTYPSGNWDTLAASVANTGSWNWLVSGPATTSARVRLTSVSFPATRDTSNANFSIIEPNQPPVLSHDPLGDLAVGTGTVTAIATDDAWRSVTTVKMYYRLAGATDFDSLSLSPTGNPNEYAASLAGMGTGSYQYYLAARDGGGLSATVPAGAPAVFYTLDVAEVCAHEMAYDDGSADWFNWSPGDAGAASAWAVQFGPVDTPFVLCGARFAVSRLWPDAAHSPVRVSVYAADGTNGLPGTLLKSVLTGSVGNVIGGLPTGTNWARAFFSDDAGGPYLVRHRQFYVAVANDLPPAYEAFGRDTGSPNAHRSFYYDVCEAQWYSEDDTLASENTYPGNRLLRAQGFSLAAPQIVIQRTEGEVRLYWPNLWAPAYHVYLASSSSGPFSLMQTTTDTFFTVTTVDTAATRRFYQVRASSE